MTYPNPEDTSKLYQSFIQMIDQFEKEAGIDNRDPSSHPLKADLEAWLLKTFPNMDANQRKELQEYAVNNRAYWRLDPTKYG